MKEVKISTGFTYQFSDDVLDDYDILQALVAVDKGHPERSMTSCLFSLETMQRSS